MMFLCTEASLCYICSTSHHVLIISVGCLVGYFFCKKVGEEVIGSSQSLLRSYLHQHGCKPQSTTYHTFQEALIAAGPRTCPSYINVEIAGGCHCSDDPLFPMTLFSFFLPAPILPLIGSGPDICYPITMTLYITLNI